MVTYTILKNFTVTGKAPVASEFLTKGIQPSLYNKPLTEEPYNG
jgi:hypothetical protein